MVLEKLHLFQAVFPESSALGGDRRYGGDGSAWVWGLEAVWLGMSVCREVAGLS